MNKKEYYFVFIWYYFLFNYEWFIFLIIINLLYLDGIFQI